MGAFMRRMKDWERRYRARFSHDIVDPEERKRSQYYMDWVDHGILRYRWHNFAEIAPGLYRSNHPNHARFEDYAKLGIKTVLNLRGATHHSHYYFEVESCKKLDLNLIDLPLRARAAASPELLLEVLDVLEQLDTPTLMHCKSGADRTGLVSALYLIHILGKPVSEAKEMLSFRFLHLKFTKTGMLDYLLHLYGKRQVDTGISLRDWIATEYDPKRTQAEFKALTFRERLKL